MYFIYKNSDNPLVSIVIFMGIEFFTLSFTALRQMIAISIILNSYGFIKKNKPIKFILMVLLASLFHKTALMFLIVYALKYISINKKTIIAGFSILLIIQLIGFNAIVYIINNIYPYYIPDNLAFTTNGMFQAAVILFYLIMGLYLYFKQTDEEDKKKLDLLYIIIFLAFSIQSFTNRIPMIGRLMWYFYIFIIILLPNQISKVKNQTIQKIAYAMVIILCLLQYILFSMNMYNVLPYEFLIK